MQKQVHILLISIFVKLCSNFNFGLFFQNFACGAESLAKTESFSVFSESLENQFDRPTKKLINFFKNLPPPRENPRSTLVLIVL